MVLPSRGDAPLVRGAVDVVSEQFGHGQASTTLDTYNLVADRMQTGTAPRVDELFWHDPSA